MTNPPIEDDAAGYLCPDCKNEIEELPPSSFDTEYGELEIDSYYCPKCGWGYDDICWPHKISELLREVREKVKQ